MAMTLSLFFACIPGIVMVIGLYEGCEELGAVFTLPDASLSCLGRVDGDASKSVSTTVGTDFAEGGWINSATFPTESERDSRERVGESAADFPLGVTSSDWLSKTGPADSLRLLLLRSTGTSKGVDFPTSETTLSLSSRCFFSARILRISSNPRDMLFVAAGSEELGSSITEIVGEP
jgi:hypothetical protein